MMGPITKEYKPLNEVYQMTLLEFAQQVGHSPITKEKVADRVEQAYKFFDQNFSLDPTDQIYFCYYLYQLVQSFKPTKVLQTGTFTGVSAMSMLLSSFDVGAPTDITTIDPEPPFYHSIHNPVSIARQIVTGNKVDEYIHFLKGYSNDAPADDPLPGNILDSLSPEYDMLVIDGDHSFQGAYQDLVNGMKNFRNGQGIIVIHDYNGIPEVRAAVDFWHNKYQNRILYSFKTAQPCGLGIFQVGPTGSNN